MFTISRLLQASAFPRTGLSRIPLQSNRLKQTLPRLPYGYDSLEPIICREIMELHHKKHHKAYVDNLKVALNKLKDALSSGDITTAIALEKDLRFNGGGHINHSIYWQNYSPLSTRIDGELQQLVVDSFGSVENLKKRMVKAVNGIEGSGWAWLAYNPLTGCLVIMTTPDQNPLFSTTGFYPLLGIDAWEHAYYLQYLNKRKDYAKALLEIVNWDDVRRRYLDAKCGIIKN